MSFRWRIIATFTVVLGLMEAVLALAYYRELERLLIDQAAHRARAQAQETIAAHARPASGRDILPVPAAHDLARALAGDRVAARVIDPTGRVLASAAAPGAMEPPAVREDLVHKAIATDEHVSSIHSSRGVRRLVLYMPLRDPGHPPAPIGVVQLSTSLGEVRESLARLRWFLLSTASATLLLGAWMALIFGGTLAVPLEKLTATCRAIARGAWGRRSELRYGTDEVGKLAVSFDAMLQRLEMAVASQQRFVADAAHQLKTPLTAISGHLELLDRDVITGEERVRASYKTMRRQVAHLDQMVRNLLTLSTLDASAPLRRQPVDLAEVARAVLEDFRPVLNPRTVRIVTDGDVWADVDADRIREALNNVVDNAIRHTGPDGTVTIEVGDGRIRVSDNGQGIPPERLGRIFDRFYRYPPDSEGSGLGLAIVRSIVEAHGGAASAESEPGRGTTITLQLPVRA